ncbi:hypothetical protein C8J56DRAFT_881954 [Mycena floridula]|nr:hypothetical protein C8J56DRAFT_881954 [Mycena floridula]
MTVPSSSSHRGKRKVMDEEEADDAVSLGSADSDGDIVMGIEGDVLQIDDSNMDVDEEGFPITDIPALPTPVPSRTGMNEPGPSRRNESRIRDNQGSYYPDPLVRKVHSRDTVVQLPVIDLAHYLNPSLDQEDCRDLALLILQIRIRHPHGETSDAIKAFRAALPAPSREDTQSHESPEMGIQEESSSVSKKKKKPSKKPWKRLAELKASTVDSSKDLREGESKVERHVRMNPQPPPQENPNSESRAAALHRQKRLNDVVYGLSELGIPGPSFKTCNMSLISRTSVEVSTRVLVTRLRMTDIPLLERMNEVPLADRLENVARPSLLDRIEVDERTNDEDGSDLNLGDGVTGDDTSRVDDEEDNESIVGITPIFCPSVLPPKELAKAEHPYNCSASQQLRDPAQGHKLLSPGLQALLSLTIFTAYSFICPYSWTGMSTLALQ